MPCVPMVQDPDQLFRRYQRTRDPRWIAQVFDATAPRLLRLAIHLVGKADEAEDLVQETFLAAIEQAEDFEASRELAPWLAGILANLARYARRRAARDPDAARLRERIERSPLEEAADSEFSGALAKALDRLKEPYRRVLLLRLRHGLAPADIAHALDESPGTVRVHIHRGMEKLRRLLPAGFASAAFLLVDPTRGLAAIRHAVVAKATVVATVSGTTSLTLGGVLVTKKIVLAVSLVIVVALVATWGPWFDGVGAEGDRDARLPFADALIPPENPPPEAVLAEDPLVSAARTELPRTPVPEVVAMHGRVADGLTELPIAGAMIELHPPTSHSTRELLELAHEHILQPSHGGFIHARGGWPRFAHQSFEERDAMAGRPQDDQLVVFGRLSLESEAIAVTRSDAEGRFEIAAPVAGGTLRLTHEDYATREVAAPHPEGAWEIPMYAPRRLRGRVVDQRDGAPIEQRLALIFYATDGSHTVTGDEDHREYSPSTSWVAETETDGTFDVSVPAAQVMVEILTPGFLHRPFPYATGTGDIAVLYVQRVPSLHVTDAETGEGIEHFAMIGRERSAGNVRWAGRFYARDGSYHMFREDGWLDQLRRNPFDLTVWAEGHLAQTFSFTDLPSAGVIEAALERGAPPAVEGRVLEDGEPRADLLVQLQPFYPRQWGLNHESTIDARRTDALGRFRLEGPAGRHLLRIEENDRVHVRVVTLPHAEVLAIDLARLAEIDVLVTDTNGTPRADYAVVLRDDAGRSDWRRTDEAGRVMFPDLPGRLFQVHVPRAETHGSFSNAIRRDVEVAEGGHETVRIELPVIGEARRPRVVTEPTVDFAGWRVRSGDENYEWIALLPNGTAPIDLQKLNWGTLEIASDTGHLWVVTVPLDAEDGYEIRIVFDGPRYEGVLLDLAGDRPLSGIRVSVRSGEGLPQPSAVSDEDGRFELRGVSDEPHRFVFNDRAAAFGGGESDGAFKGLSFHANEPPGDPTSLTIRVPCLRSGAFRGLGVKRVSGHVLREGGGDPLAGWRVSFLCELPEAQGTLRLWTSAGLTRTDDGGEYEVELPDVPRYEVRIGAPEDRAVVLRETWDGLPGDEEVRDFVIE